MCGYQNRLKTDCGYKIKPQLQRKKKHTYTAPRRQTILCRATRLGEVDGQLCVPPTIS